MSGDNILLEYTEGTKIEPGRKNITMTEIRKPPGPKELLRSITERTVGLTGKRNNWAVWALKSF